jgi:hypothetical protein
MMVAMTRLPIPGLSGIEGECVDVPLAAAAASRQVYRVHRAFRAASLRLMQEMCLNIRQTRPIVDRGKRHG